jgi:hypothetical protein
MEALLCRLALLTSMIARRGHLDAAKTREYIHCGDAAMNIA